MVGHVLQTLEEEEVDTAFHRHSITQTGINCSSGWCIWLQHSVSAGAFTADHL